MQSREMLGKGWASRARQTRAGLPAARTRVEGIRMVNRGDQVDANAIDLQLDRPHSARMYDYYLGGRTNFTADREAVGKVMAVFPAALVAARANRDFVLRSTRFLAEHGVDQFLDIGTGIPTSPNLHEVVQRVRPEARIVYVDNDPIVLAHAQALLTSHPSGRTAYVEADLTEPETILSSPALAETLDLSRPVTLSLNAVLHFVAEARPGPSAHEIVETLKAALAPGSALVISHGTADFAPVAAAETTQIYRAAGTSAQPRSRAEFERFFHGWDPVEPGITVTHRWRPEETDRLSDISDAEACCYAAVAFKP
jgi:S-adenosyl methyltransferase